MLIYHKKMQNNTVQNSVSYLHTCPVVFFFFEHIINGLFIPFAIELRVHDLTLKYAATLLATDISKLEYRRSVFLFCSDIKSKIYITHVILDRHCSHREFLYRVSRF